MRHCSIYCPLTIRNSPVWKTQPSVRCSSRTTNNQDTPLSLEHRASTSAVHWTKYEDHFILSHRALRISEFFAPIQADHPSWHKENDRRQFSLDCEMIVVAPQDSKSYLTKNEKQRYGVSAEGVFREIGGKEIRITMIWWLCQCSPQSHTAGQE